MLRKEYKFHASQLVAKMDKATLRDLTLFLRFGTPQPQSKERVTNSISTICEILNLRFYEVTEILNSDPNDLSSIQHIPKPKPIRLNEEQIENITSTAVLAAQLKYSILRRLLLLRQMYPDAKITYHYLRKIYKQ